MRSGGIAAQFTAMNGLSARSLVICTARASTSLPTPVSPSSRTDTLLSEALVTISSACLKGFEEPTMLGSLSPSLRDSLSASTVVCNLLNSSSKGSDS